MVLESFAFHNVGMALPLEVGVSNDAQYPNPDVSFSWNGGLEQALQLKYARPCSREQRLRQPSCSPVYITQHYTEKQGIF